MSSYHRADLTETRMKDNEASETGARGLERSCHSKRLKDVEREKQGKSTVEGEKYGM